jgi:hypothetical protein
VKELLEDEVKFKDFFDSLTAVRDVRSLVSEMKRANQDTTEKNIKLQQEIEEARSQLQAAQARDMDLRNRVNQLYQQKQAIEKVCFRLLFRLLVTVMSTNIMRNMFCLVVMTWQRMSPENLVPKLNELARQTNRESDELSDQLLRGELDVKEFLSRFQQRRVLYHTRIYKRDAMTKSPPPPHR